MSLPPGFLDELRTRTSLTQVVGRKVMWDQRKSNQGKGDMWAPCPFHQEKSASFHVDDRKGFYYCFGCQAKGDAISFVRETENVSFMEAVEILAREASMTMPARDPKAQEKSDARTELANVMEQAVQFFRLSLKTGAAEGARAYLAKRGLDEAAQARHDIGFSPDGRQAVFQHLTGKGIDPKLIIEAGLAAVPDNGGAPYDRFRGRIIFPIRDPRGRCIALGGRAMDPNARAKYLNSPETLLFDKGRSLYNHGPAREAAGKGAPLIVAEGYMDVIALSEAGFKATVAPLGTAITENQLQLLWRIAPEPIIALDGDKAGLRAALRLIDLALPLLEAGKSLRFAIMPEGLDPDDLLKSKGPAAMQALIDGAEPMVKLLWEREIEGKIFDSPERKAALDKSLRAAISKIQDPSIKRHYGDEIKELRYNLFRPKRSDFSKGRGGKKWVAEPAVVATTKQSTLVASGEEAGQAMREAVVLATCLLNPEAILAYETPLERLRLSSEAHHDLRNALLEYGPNYINSPSDLRNVIEQEIGIGTLEMVLSQRHVQIAPAVRHAGDLEIAKMCLAEELAKLLSKQGSLREVAQAMEDITGEAGEWLTSRLGQVAEARNRAERSETKDTVEYQQAENGALLKREELDKRDALWAKISFSKNKGRP